MLPTFFNINLPITIGIPTILNPVYFIPFVFTPIINMLLGSVAIWFNMFPPSVFLVPEGTPGVLNLFMGTGGNIYSLIFTIFLVIVDVLIYIPFIKLENEVEAKYEESIHA